MDTLTFSFDELPLCIAPGIEAAIINGSAEVVYGKSGEWFVKSVNVEGYTPNGDGKFTRVSIPASIAVEAIVIGRLNNEWRQKIVDAVRERIAGDCEERAA